MGNHPNESPDLGPVDVNDNTAHPDKTYDSVREHRILHLSDYLITRPEPDHTAADSKDGNTCVEGISGPAAADTPGLDCQTEISDDARRRREDWPALSPAGLSVVCVLLSAGVTESSSVFFLEGLP